jgi:hypothetical protein
MEILSAGRMESRMRHEYREGMVTRHRCTSSRWVHMPLLVTETGGKDAHD